MIATILPAFPCYTWLPTQQRSRLRLWAACRAGPAAQLECVAFTLIVDDIVYWDGRTRMGELGGGGPQTLWGFLSVANASVGLAAGVGRDLPAAATEWLHLNGIDTAGMVQRGDLPTPRAWQVLEADGRRHEIWRTQPGEAQSAALLPALSTLPPAYRAAKSYHLGLHPERPPLELLHRLREAAGPTGLVSAETFTHAERPVPRHQLQRFLPLLDVFSPNQREAASILYGADCPPEQLEEAAKNPLLLTAPFIQAGAPLVTLRCGAGGAVVHERDSNQAWYVPAFPQTAAVDTTGCGNVFCGAFLAAMQAGAGAAAAAAAASAAASVMAEAPGVPRVVAGELQEEVRRRAKELQLLVHSV